MGFLGGFPYLLQICIICKNIYHMTTCRFFCFVFKETTINMN